MRRSLLCSALLVLATTLDMNAKDHILTIGGGYSPSGNQVSLERNVIFFEKLRSEKLGADTKHDLYFADWNYLLLLATHCWMLFRLTKFGATESCPICTCVYMCIR
ncbi:MAG: hypothetical protein MK312_08765, partial [Roseibacillus sp.]|nr:hypothetical protein [Roseibacillus sp.]